jgi:hypothetical protein
MVKADILLNIVVEAVFVGSGVEVRPPMFSILGRI